MTDDRQAHLPDYEPGAGVGLTDAERWPALSPDGFARLAAVREHPHAPVWVHSTGDRLTTEDVDRLRTPPAAPDPDWLEEMTRRLQRTVPRHRRRPVARFADVVPSDRAELAARTADFVPDDAPLGGLVQGSSSGTSGAALMVPLHPTTIAAELVLLERLLGVAWPVDPSRLGLAAVVHQRHAYTYVSAMTVREETMMARVNLHEDSWRAPGDREAFLAEHDPAVVTGPSMALLEYAALPVDLHPLALVSGATHLTPAARGVLEERFGVPVLDVYALKETGVIAVSTDGGPHRVVDRRLHVEVLDPAGRPVPAGERGEITVTVDDNPLLPLLRYRTGDHASLSRSADGAVLLHDLAGRQPVRLRRPDSRWVPDVDLTQLLQHHGALGWHVHQSGTGEVHVRLRGGSASAVRAALAALLSVDVTVEPVADLGEGKPRLFSSDVPGGLA